MDMVLLDPHPQKECYWCDEPLEYNRTVGWVCPNQDCLVS